MKMANEIRCQYDPGKTLYAMIRDEAGQVWNGSAWEVYGASEHTAEDYNYALTDKGGGEYIGNFPTSITTAGSYTAFIFEQAGSSPAGPPTDLSVGTQTIRWSGAGGVAATVASTARTRGMIKALVHLHTGRVKDTLENYLCDSALKFALMRHHFKDAQSQPSDLVIAEDATSVSIASISGLMNIITARIVETDGTRNALLILKTKRWWDEHIVNADDNMKGWPKYGMRWGTTILLDRPAESGLSLRLRITTTPSFSDDTTQCPIEVLDLFVEHYVTAHVFKSLRNSAAYSEWIMSALGARYLIDGSIGGELANAIEADSIGELAVDVQSGRPNLVRVDEEGIAAQNLIEGHGDYGNTRWWN